MFDAFLSYSRLDQPSVEAVAKLLRGHDLNPFLDRWHLAAGQPWQNLLAERLKECRSVVVFIGPGEMGSWQRREKEYALNRQASEEGFPVIPVLLPGVDDPALDFLGLNTWIDLRGGIENPQAIAGLVAAINGQPPGAEDGQPDPRADVCPYRGLQPFREEDAAFFFGRDTFAETLQQKLRSERFLAVVGASGSGKSSVVRAGLVPRLRDSTNDESWDVLTLFPGAEPLNALVQAFDPPPADMSRIQKIQSIKAGAASLRDGSVTLSDLTEALLSEQPGTVRLLLVVDQFEELFTLISSDNVAERECFLDLLLQATKDEGRLSVIITMRGDFYARALARRDLADRLQDTVINIGPLSTTGEPMSEIEEVIRKPAEAIGLGFEDGLVEQILRDVGAEPGNLPLLEFLLTELWRLRKNGVMTNGAYSDLGGVEGAIAARADETLAALSDAEKQDAKRLMLMLVRPGQGQEDTRARATIPDDADLHALVQRFAHANTRLLTTSDDDTLGRTVEVSHEALIRNWKQYREWIDENRDRLRVRERVRERMQRWAEGGKTEDLLLPTGLDLEEGRALLERTDDLPVEDLRAFIEASINAENERLAAIEAARKAEQEREVRSQRQRRNIFAGAFAVSLILLGLAGWQYREAKEALQSVETMAKHAIAARNDLEAEKARRFQDAQRTDIIGDLIIYTTSAGNMSFDGLGENSLYTTAAIKHLKNRDLSFSEALRLATADVIDSSRELQVPEFTSNLTGEVFLHHKPEGRNYLAMTIGISNYEHVRELDNTINDAVAWRDLLSSAGFQVTHLEDLTGMELKEEFLKLQSKLIGFNSVPRGTGARKTLLEIKHQDMTYVLFFAGHSFQIGNEFYLVPSDFQASNEFEAVSEAISLSQIKKYTESFGVRILVFDAVRDNPFRN